MFNLETLIQFFLPVLLDKGEAALDIWLDDFFTKSPTWYETAVIVLNRLLTAHVAEIVEATKTQADDMAFDKTLAELKANAAKHGITI